MDENKRRIVTKIRELDNLTKGITLSSEMWRKIDLYATYLEREYFIQATDKRSLIIESILGEAFESDKNFKSYVLETDRMTLDGSPIDEYTEYIEQLEEQKQEALGMSLDERYESCNDDNY